MILAHRHPGTHEIIHQGHVHRPVSGNKGACESGAGQDLSQSALSSR